jgi:hypothetical protein
MVARRLALLATILANSSKTISILFRNNTFSRRRRPHSHLQGMRDWIELTSVYFISCYAVNWRVFFRCFFLSLIANLYFVIISYSLHSVATTTSSVEVFLNDLNPASTYELWFDGAIKAVCLLLTFARSIFISVLLMSLSLLR